MRQQKRLVRDNQNRMLGGVCSGIANYFNWDPTWVRIGAALSVLFFAGTPVLIYIILWIIIPTDTNLYEYAPNPVGYQANYGYPNTGSAPSGNGSYSNIPDQN